jgi:hypothetical protein
MDIRLSRQIAGIKQELFPELKWVHVRGIYVPTYNLIKDRRLAVVGQNHLKRNFNNGILSSAIGFADIIMAQALASPIYSDERIGIIYHELSHLVTEDPSEKAVDNEAITRGGEYYLMKAASLIERFSGDRNKVGSYSSRELAVA